jgi:hypothetical protein
MMISTTFVLHLIAFVLFVLAAIGIPSRVNLVAAGLACVSLAALVGPLGLP